MLSLKPMKFITLLVGNALGFTLASAYISGVALAGDLQALLIVSLIFTVANFIIKPILKLLLGPFILLTFGLLTIVINMAMLWLTDVLSPQLAIANITSLFLATLLIGAINIIIHIVFKK